MNSDPIIFALSNPEPEILPEDYPNQINNVLVFPGLFKGLLTARIAQVEQKHMIAAAEALAKYVQNPNEHEIIPSALDKDVAELVAKAVAEA